MNGRWLSPLSSLSCSVGSGLDGVAATSGFVRLESCSVLSVSGRRSGFRSSASRFSLSILASFDSLNAGPSRLEVVLLNDIRGHPCLDNVPFFAPLIGGRREPVFAPDERAILAFSRYVVSLLAFVLKLLIASRDPFSLLLRIGALARRCGIALAHGGSSFGLYWKCWKCRQDSNLHLELRCAVRFPLFPT